jgi:hypothetical protein
MMTGEVLFKYTCQGNNALHSHYPETLDDVSVEIRIPSTELNIHQYFAAFKNFLRAVEFDDYTIMSGAASVAFHEFNSKENNKKLQEEYELQDVVPQYELEEMIEKKALELIKDPETLLVAKLKNAYKVCYICGNKYGDYSVGCSSHWEDQCDVCGELSNVTEARDFNYLASGILKLKK